MSKPYAFKSATRIAEDHLVPGQQYYLKLKDRGEGIVEFMEIAPGIWSGGLTVGVVSGGFNLPMARMRKGDVMSVAPGVGQFYEVKG